MYINNAFYCAYLIPREDLNDDGSSDKLYTEIKHERVAYLNRLIPFGDTQILVRYDESIGAFWFDDVKIAPEWLADEERIFVRVGENN